MHRTIILCSALLSVIGGCTPSPVGSTGPQTVRSAQQANLEGSFVPAGTRFAVRLEQPLDTMTTPAGTPFTAIVLQPLANPSGHVIVPAQARVRGHVRSVIGQSGVPRLRLQFESVDSVAGIAPLQVRVAGSNPQIYRSPVLGYSPYLYDTFNGPAGGSFGGGPAAPWVQYGGYSTFDYSVYLPREVHLDTGSTLDLTLTRPLLGPDARVIAR